MDTLVTTPLSALETHLNALTTSLTSTPTFATAPSTTQQLLTADTALTSALSTLHQHQQNYARILRLRDEATRLENQIKDTIRTCGELRKEIGDVCPGVLDDDSSDDSNEGEERANEKVDYHTLLSFARRIGRYNAAAAKEAEEDAIRRKVEARRKAAESARTSGSVAQITNGTGPSAVEGAAPGAELQTTNQQITSPSKIVTEGEHAWLNEPALQVRAMGGLPFPAAEQLRLGELGQLQLLREREGPDGGEAVERAVDKMVAEAEGFEQPSSAGVGYEIKETIIEVPEGNDSSGRRESKGLSTGGLPSAGSRGPPHRQPERKKTLDLDLWDEDDDEDDD